MQQQYRYNRKDSLSRRNAGKQKETVAMKELKEQEEEEPEQEQQQHQEQKDASEHMNGLSTREGVTGASSTEPQSALSLSLAHVRNKEKMSMKRKEEIRREKIQIEEPPFADEEGYVSLYDEVQRGLSVSDSAVVSPPSSMRSFWHVNGNEKRALRNSMVSLRVKECIPLPSPPLSLRSSSPPLLRNRRQKSPVVHRSSRLSQGKQNGSPSSSTVYRPNHAAWRKKQIQGALILAKPFQTEWILYNKNNGTIAREKGR